MDEDEEKIAVAATFGISAVFKSHRSPSKSKLMAKNKNELQQQHQGPSGQNVDKERLSVDISALKKQYSKLRQRQKQAQIILSSKQSSSINSLQYSHGVFLAAMTKDTGITSSRSSSVVSGSSGHTPVPLNHLLLGKKPLVASRPRRGPPPGAIPPSKNKSRTPKSSDEPQQRLSTSSNGGKLNPTQIACPQVRAF